jgi:hypothetical protein
VKLIDTGPTKIVAIGAIRTSRLLVQRQGSKSRSTHGGGAGTGAAKAIND